MLRRRHAHTGKVPLSSPTSGTPPFIRADSNSGSGVPSPSMHVTNSVIPTCANSCSSPVSDVITNGRRSPRSLR